MDVLHVQETLMAGLWPEGQQAASLLVMVQPETGRAASGAAALPVLEGGQGAELV